MALGDVVVKSWEEADKYLGKKDDRPLGYATRLQRLSDTDIGLLHHYTHIIIYHDNHTTTIDCKGWRSRTTKDRVNMFTPYRINVWQEAGVWYISDSSERYWEDKIRDRAVYYDGIKIDSKGNIISEALDPQEEGKRIKDLTNRINKFAGLCAEAVPLPMPGAGDCWFCALQTQEGESLGDATDNTDHLESHMEEEYVVPVLVWRALEEAGYNPQKQIIHAIVFDQYEGWDDFDFARERVKRSVSRYMKRRLGVAS